jgi:hypothetical protein
MRLRSWTNFSLEFVEIWRTFYWPCLISQPWIKQSCKLCIVMINFLNIDKKKHWEPSPTWRQFMPPMLQPKYIMSAPNDNPMQINKTWFKPLTKHEKQCWHVNNLCLYCEEPGQIAGACPKTRVQHVACPTTSTTTQMPKEKGNEDIKSQYGPWN